MVTKKLEQRAIDSNNQFLVTTEDELLQKETNKEQRRLLWPIGRCYQQDCT